MRSKETLTVIATVTEAVVATLIVKPTITVILTINKIYNNQ